MIKWIRRILGISEIEEDVEELEKNISELEDLEERVQELEDLKDQLQDKVLEGDRDLQRILGKVEESEGIERKELVDWIQEELGFSETTAYRKVKSLEEELSFIRENQEKQLVAPDFSHS